VIKNDKTSGEAHPLGWSGGHLTSPRGFLNGTGECTKRTFHEKPTL